MTDLTFRSDVTARLMSHMGDDAAIVAAARVSTTGAASEEFRNMPAEESAGLLNFLMKNRHGTPYEHNSMTFLIEAPIMVFREFHRHRIGWSYNEASARYSVLPATFYVPGADRNLVQTGKPGHYEFLPGTSAQYADTVKHLQMSFRDSYKQYEYLMEQGVAKEVARAVLPVAIFSSMYATCNARSLMSFLSLRTKREGSTFPSFPMREIEMVAEQMEEHFEKLFPITWTAFNKHGRVAP